MEWFSFGLHLATLLDADDGSGGGGGSNGGRVVVMVAVVAVIGEQVHKTDRVLFLLSSGADFIKSDSH